MARVQQNQATPNQSPTIHRYAVVSPTVRASVANDLKFDASEDRELAQRLLVAGRWPALAERATCEDDLTWDELLSMDPEEADEMERDERRNLSGVFA